MSHKLTQYIDVDVNETVNIRVSLTVDNIIDFIKECADDERQEIILALKASGVSTRQKPSEYPLFDSMKMEFIKDNFNRISLDDLKTIIK